MQQLDLADLGTVEPPSAIWSPTPGLTITPFFGVFYLRVREGLLHAASEGKRYANIKKEGSADWVRVRVRSRRHLKMD